MHAHGKMFEYTNDNPQHSKRIKYNTTKPFEHLLKVRYGVNLVYNVEGMFWDLYPSFNIKVSTNHWTSNCGNWSGRGEWIMLSLFFQMFILIDLSQVVNSSWY